MRIGFYTSAFNDRPLEEVLDFAREAGFDAHLTKPYKLDELKQLLRSLEPG